MAAWNLINHTELSGEASSYDVTSIPASYMALLLMVSARTDRPSTHLDDHWIKFNNDSGYNYNSITIYSGSSAVYSNANFGVSQIENHNVFGAATNSDVFSVNEFWIPNYANTSNWKNMVARSNAPPAEAGDWKSNGQVTASLWESTAAINRITLTPKGGHDYQQYSTFTLYGIGAA